MGTTEIVVVATFVVLLMAGLAAGIRQGAQHREQMARFAASHGYRPATGDPQLAALLEQVSADSRWRPSITLAGAAPAPFYFFAAQMRPQEATSRYASNVHACLVRNEGGPPSQVSVFTRTPGGDRLLSDRVELGSEAFRSKFTVSARDPRVAAQVVSPGIEALLAEHAAGRNWYITIDIGPRGVLAYSHWAATEADWDYLIGFTQRVNALVH